jgi:hypothetical protein
MSSLPNLSVTQLRQVISIKEKIEALEAELAAVTGGEAAAPAAVPVGGRGKYKRSAAARAAMAAAQKARWAKVKGENDEAAPKKKRKMSRAGRARMAAAAKARWAAAKAAGKNSL